MGIFNQKNIANPDKKDGPAMHKITCSNCGKDAEVPFKPTGDRPLFCSDCFEKKKNTNPRKSNFGNKQMHKATCSNCGKEAEVPFKPTGNKPVYCSDCFEKGGNAPARNIGQGQDKGQLEVLNAKLDKIIDLLGSDVSAKATKEIKTPKAKKVAKKKVAAKKKTTKKK